MNPATASLKDRLNLSYEDNYVPHPLFADIVSDDINLISEIVYNGLGLGYNVQTEKAYNPLNWTPIKDPQMILDSRVDRAMLMAAVELSLLVLYPIKRHQDIHRGIPCELEDLTPKAKARWREGHRSKITNNLRGGCTRNQIYTDNYNIKKVI